MEPACSNTHSVFAHHFVAMDAATSEYTLAHVAGGTVGGLTLGLTLAVVAFLIFMKLRQQRLGVRHWCIIKQYHITH